MHFLRFFRVSRFRNAALLLVLLPAVGTFDAAAQTATVRWFVTDRSDG